jgi:hypothetical protein
LQRAFGQNIKKVNIFDYFGGNGGGDDGDCSSLLSLADLGNADVLLGETLSEALVDIRRLCGLLVCLPLSAYRVP